MDLRVVNPFDQSLVCRLPLDHGSALDRKVRASYEASKSWRRTALEERIRQVQRGLQRFRKSGPTIAREITQQMGKPITQARREVETFFDRANYMVEIAQQTLRPDVLPPKAGFVRRIEHEPFGVVLNIAAWNYPLLIPVNVVVPALLAGNTVLLKHSALTPLCGRAFGKAFGDLEIRNLVVSVVLTHPQIAKLIGDCRIGYVAFTGSVRGGREIYKEAAKRLLPVGLELGGKDPAYVAEDADLDFAAAQTVDGAFYNAGQSCCAVERVYVHRSLYPDFLKKAQALIEQYRMGDPMDEATTMGPLASAAAIGELESKVKEAQKRGARLLCGGKPALPIGGPCLPAGRRGSEGNFFEPTLLADVPNKARIMREETFGPVMPVHPVANDEAALRLMNDTPFGLTASIWTRSARRAERFARELEVGTVYRNRCDYLDPALPWTGARDSGLGSTLSCYGFYGLTRRKSIHFRDA